MREPEVVLITGTSRGIGAYLAEHFAARGAQVVGCSRSPVEPSYSNVVHFQCNVADETQVRALMRFIHKTYSRLDVTINNGIAVTEVTQVFRNRENRVVEALYTFPVPDGASVANFSMWISGKEMIGEVVEKARARQIYESYKPVQRDPGLLELADDETFKMRIFPIAARAAQKVKIRYYQELGGSYDQLTYVYPLAMGPKQGQSKTTGKFAMTVQVKSKAPIVSVSSPSHGRSFGIVQPGRRSCLAVLEGVGVDLNRDVVVSCKLAAAPAAGDLVASKIGGEDGYFCLTLSGGEELEAGEGGMDCVFVLDVSGSMGDEGKLSACREFLAALIAGMGEADRFDIVAFDARPRSLLGTLTRADAAGRGRARKALSSQTARGRTAIGPALSRAYARKDPARPLNVVLLTDGMADRREREELVQLVDRRPSGTRVFCVGVGNEADRPLLRQLARETGGLAEFLAFGDDLKRRAEALRGKLAHQAATGVKIAFDGVEVYDLEPPAEAMGNLYHGAGLRVYGRYRGAGAAGVSVRADVGGSPVARTTKVTFPAADAGNPEIDRMWATRRVERLVGQLGRMRETQRVFAAVEEIVRLGEGFSIVTPHTSFIVLENDAEYRRWQIDRKNALRIPRDRAGRDAMKEKLKVLREAAMAKAVPTVGPAAATPSTGTRELKLELPRPLFISTPMNIKLKFRPRIPNRRIVVPAGEEVWNVARGKRVTSSDSEPIIGDLDMIADGDKSGRDGSYVELGPGRQWVQIDLRGKYDIYVIVLWHYHAMGRVYKDVIVQVADDADFIRNVETVFNNDHDNSSGIGVGKDWQYLEEFRGEAIQFHPSEPVTARYVRFYSNGNSTNDLNHYTEVEIWGRPAR